MSLQLLMLSPFGGFLSCQAGNPLAVSLQMRKSGNLTAANSPKRCPKLYKKVMATVDEQCEISYCAKIKSEFSVNHPILPPYRSKSILKKNLTQSLVIQGAYGEFWVKQESGNWVKDTSQSVSGKELLQQLQSTGGSAGSSDGGSDADDSGKSAAGVCWNICISHCHCVHSSCSCYLRCIRAVEEKEAEKRTSFYRPWHK